MRIFVVVLFLCGLLFAGEYQVDSNKNNNVKFISDAPIEDFEGVTDHIDGYIYWEGEDLLNKSDMYFEVDLNTLDTGIGLRNRHMRDNYLETDKFPKASFKGKIVKAELTPQKNYQVEVSGVFTVHGVKRALKVKGNIIPEGDVRHIRTSFTVKLSDYKIKIPSIMFYKIDENMQVVLDFYVKKVKDNP